MLIYLYSILLSATLLPAIDRLRELRIKGKKANVNHKVSGLIAGIVAVGLWYACHGLYLTWWLILYAIGFMAARGLVYDGMLNLLNRLPFSHLSFTTDAKTDGWMNRFSFWAQRLIYAGVLGLVILITYLFV